MIFKKIIILALPLLLSCTAARGEEPKSGGSTGETRPTKFATDDEMLDYIQKVHFNYMWDGAEPVSGLAPERIHLDNIYPDNDPDVITIGGSGFGVAGLLVAIERGFIPREKGVERLTKIVDYLGRADRFHGVWPHWLHGPTGKVKPFGVKDNGGDLVESCFMMESLLCVRQYFKDGNKTEKDLANKVDKLWKEMEFDWYQNGQDAIFWHWSPSYGWQMNFPLKGYDETFIVYILAASSPTHGVTPDAYNKCWARDGAIKSESAPYGFPLEVKHNGAEQFGGPLFWSQYSWIGLDPRNLKDQYATYWNVTRNHAMANYSHCVENPKKWKGYGTKCWGLTASYSVNGYNAHSPSNDTGVITPTAALSSFPYTPTQSMDALKYFYFEKGAWIWGKYGFYDAFSETNNWTMPRYLAIDQCTIAPMIENHRTGLLWKLFMSCPEVQTGLTKLGFTY